MDKSFVATLVFGKSSTHDRDKEKVHGYRNAVNLVHERGMSTCALHADMLTVAPAIDTRTLERLFRHHVLKMLFNKGRVTRDMIALLDRWHHSGFHVYCGPRILPRQKTSMENLVRYIIRASFSQERMTYVPEAGFVIYRSKDGQTKRVFDALERPRQKAVGCKHTPPCAATFLVRANHANGESPILRILQQHIPRLAKNPGWMRSSPACSNQS